MADTTTIHTLDSFEEEYAKGAGEALPSAPAKQANIDNIQRFGDGAGDYNPLFRNEEHAAESRYGMVTASPMFIYSVGGLGVMAAIYGNIDPSRLSTLDFPANYAGGRIEFHRPIWRDDWITATEQVVGIERKHSERIGPFCICTALVSYHNQRKELVATKETLMARYLNLGDGQTIEYDREAKAEMEQVAPDPLVWERQRRGAETRYWDDVNEGDDVPTLQKGTYTVTELFLFTHGALGTGRSTRAALDAEGTADLGGGGRFDEEHAKRRRNMPGQFDFGPQRVCWLGQMAMDWMGDDGTLKRMGTPASGTPTWSVIPTPSYGKVSGKRVEDGEGLVELDLWNENQAGLATALSKVTVSLPMRK